MDEDDAPKPTGPGRALRPALRARRLRRLVRRRHQGSAPATRSSTWPSARSATSSTAAPPGAEANTGDGAGILLQVPDRFLREVVDFALPPAGQLRASASRFLPADPRRRREGRGRHRGDRRRRGPAGRSAGATCPVEPGRPRRDGPRGHARLPAAVPRRPGGRRGHRRSTASVYLRPQAHRARGAAPPTASAASTSRRCRAARSSTRACSPRRSSARSSPTSPTSGSSRRWPWCTAGSRPTRSRRGRWPTRTATSPTTARSTPCRATATGCGPARRCWPATCCPATSSRVFPICTPGASRLGQLRRGARAAAPRRPHACPTRC